MSDDPTERRREVELFFDEYVHWMRSDIAREIGWVRPVVSTGVGRLVRALLRQRPRGAGNLLCALGLLVYTEALGRVLRWNAERLAFFAPDGRERPRENFEAAFDRLGDGQYGVWRKEWEAPRFDTSLYEVLRSGMVHEYRPKIPANIHLGFEQDRGVDYAEGRLSFYVVPYFRHFSTLADQLRSETLALPQPSLPEPHLREGPNAIYTGRPFGSISGSTG